MIYRVVEQRFGELVDESATFETLASGFRFTEGASWHPGERHITFSDIPSSRIHRWYAETADTVILREPSNMTNGTTYDREGRLLMCEHASSSVTRLEADGSVTLLAERWQGNELNSPNDIVVDDAGNTWFTDPMYGREAATGVAREPGLPFCGVFRIDRDGELHLVADDYEAPNGLCFSPDQRRIYVNDSERSQIRVYDIAADGTATGGDCLAKTADTDGTLGSGSPDGMKVDALGNIWCAGPGGIHVFEPDGALLGILLTPAFPANFCFGGDDLKTLFICAGQNLLRIRVGQAGHRLFY